MRICSGAGCLRAVPDDVRFCDECKPHVPVADGIREQSLGYDAEIDKLNQGKRWHSIRGMVLKRDPVCKRCDRQISVIADHIVPAKIVIMQAQLSGKYPLDRYAGYFLLSNLQGICRECHYTKTNEDKAHIGAWPDAIEKEALAPKRKFFF